MESKKEKKRQKGEDSRVIERQCNNEEERRRRFLPHKNDNSQHPNGEVLFEYNKRRKIIKIIIGKDLDLLQRVKESFGLDGEIVLQKYNDSWKEWVDVNSTEIRNKDQIKVVRRAEPHNQNQGMSPKSSTSRQGEHNPEVNEEESSSSDEEDNVSSEDVSVSSSDEQLRDNKASTSSSSDEDKKMKTSRSRLWKD